MRKFTLFFMSLFLTIGAMAQFESGKLYRIKTTNGQYMTIGDTNTNSYGNVYVTNLNENSSDQKFEIISSNDKYKIKSAAGEYFTNSAGEGSGWNVNATTNEAQAMEIIFESTGNVNEFYLRKDAYSFFKTDLVKDNASPYYHVYHDGNTTNRTTFIVEEVIPTYAHNTGSLNRNDRGLTSFTITDGKNSLAVTGIQTTSTAPVYVDKSAQKLTTYAGATLSFSAFSYTGAWMHAYAYVDYNKDYYFELTNNNDGTTEGEIVSYNYYNGNTITGTAGSQSDAMTSEHNGSKTLPAFTLPADLEPGEYRMRIKIDWNNIDADLGASDIAANGGCQCDITLVVIPAPHTLNVTSAGWATLFLDFPAAIPTVEDEEKGVFIATGMTTPGYIDLVKVTGVLPANTGVIVRMDAGEYEFTYSNGTPANVSRNLLRGSATNTYVEGLAYVLSNKNGIGLYKAELNKNATGGEGNTHFLNNANKAYLPDGTGSSNIASYNFRFGEGTTGVEEVKAENGEVKAIYDLTGRRVEVITAPGIYIVGGKKVLVK